MDGIQSVSRTRSRQNKLSQFFIRMVGWDHRVNIDLITSRNSESSLFSSLFFEIVGCMYGTEIKLIAVFLASSGRRSYFDVVTGLEWPRIFCTETTSIPSTKQLPAKVLNKSCGLHAMPAAIDWRRSEAKIDCGVILVPAILLAIFTCKRTASEDCV